MIRSPAWRLLAPAPNPFNPRTTIAFEAPAGGGYATVRVYDVRGSAVRTLVDGHVDGAQTIVWSGDDDAGNAVGSGVYYVQLQSGSYAQTRKIVLAR